MSLHGLGGPSKHNAAEEFWRQRLAKEAKAAEAKATSDSRVSSGFAPAQRSAYVAAEPLIPRAGDYRCARLPPPIGSRTLLFVARPPPPAAHTRPIQWRRLPQLRGDVAELPFRRRRHCAARLAARPRGRAVA